MTMVKIFAVGAGLAAIATAAPASAQYYYSGNVTQIAADRCAAAVQNRLNNRGGRGILGVLGLGNDRGGRVLSITQAVPRRNGVVVRGLATSDAYGAYGVGAYGMLGSAYARPDLSFRCNVDYRGYIRDVDIMRR